MGACASKFKGFKDDVLPPAEEEEVAAAASRDVKIVEATVNKDEVPAAVEDGEAKPRSLGHLLKEIEGEKGSAENGNATSPKPVAADSEAKGKAEKALPATDDINKNNPDEKNVEEEEEDVKPDSENVGVEASDKKTEEKSMFQTEKKKTEHEPTETTKLETQTETTKHETLTEMEKKIEENKLAEDTKIEAPATVEEDDKHIVEPTMTENPVENRKAAEVKTDEKKPVSDEEKTKDEEDETKN